jgi:hypothetical protein
MMCPSMRANADFAEDVVETLDKPADKTVGTYQLLSFSSSSFSYKTPKALK